MKIKKGTKTELTWVTKEDVKNWKEGSVVLIHRPGRSAGETGCYDIITWFRPDWLGTPYYDRGDLTLFAKIR